MRLRPCRKRKLLPSGIQVTGAAIPAPPRPPPPRPAVLRVSSVMGCFWAKAEAARRRMLNFVMVAIVAIRQTRSASGTTTIGTVAETPANRAGNWEFGDCPQFAPRNNANSYLRAGSFYAERGERLRQRGAAGSDAAYRRALELLLRCRAIGDRAGGGRARSGAVRRAAAAHLGGASQAGQWRTGVGGGGGRTAH